MDTNAAIGADDDWLSELTHNGVPSAPATSPSPPTASLKQNLDVARIKQQSDISAAEKEMQPSVDKFKQTAAQPMPQAPAAPKATPAPEMKQIQEDSQGWISAMSVLSALVGGRGRAKGTGALQAYAAGLNGIREGNQQAFENSYKTWKANQDAMFKEADEEMNRYKAVLEDRKMTENEQIQAINVIGAEHENTLMSDAKDVAQAGAVYDSAIKAKIGAQAFVDKLEVKKNMADAEQEKQMQKFKDDPATTSLADAYHSGVPITTLVKGIGKDAQYKAQAIQDAAKEKYGDFDWAEQHNKYMARGSELRGISTMAGKIELGGSLLDKSIPSMLAAAERVGLSESTDLNTLYNTAKRHLSDQDFQNFATQLRATTSDYALFLGRGRQTVHSDQEALRILSEDMGVTSLKGFRDAVAAERANTSAAIDESLGREPKQSPAVAGWSIQPAGD